MKLDAIPPDSRPDSIGRYSILSLLGRGSMAKVYLARDPVVDRKIALKVIAPTGPVDVVTWQTLRTRFLLEARAAGKLHHPNAVSIFDADTDEATGLAYIAMEWVDGRSLDQILATRGPIDIEVSVSIAKQVASALDAAHQQGLIHRDVKPANILIDQETRAKLSDFGIVKFEDLSLTSTGGVVGTPLYMSPEQLRGRDLDGRSDLFSLGVVLYQCLTGSPPFAGDTVAELTYQIQHSNPRAPQWVNPAIPGALAAVVLKAIAKDPRARPQTGAELARRLDLALDSPTQPLTTPAPEAQGTSTVSIGSTELRRAMSVPDAETDGPTRRATVAVIGFTVLAIIALAALFLDRPVPRADSSPAPPSIPARETSTGPTPAAQDPVANPNPDPVITRPETSAGPPAGSEDTAIDSTDGNGDWIDHAEEVLDDAERIYKLSVGKSRQWWKRVTRDKQGGEKGPKKDRPGKKDKDNKGR